MRLLFLTICVLMAVVDSAKILGIFPIPAKSQHLLGNALMKALAARGHQVTIITPFKSSNPTANYREIFIDDASEMKEKHLYKFFNPNNTIFDQLRLLKPTAYAMASFALENHNVKDFLALNETFDVTIQQVMFNEALFGIGYKLRSPIIAFSSIGTTPWLNYHTGNPAPNSYVPNIFLPFTNEMTFKQRVINTAINALFYGIMHYINMPLQNAVLKEYFPDAPELDVIMNDIDLHLVNSHFTTESMRPYMPTMIRIGGYHLQEVETLPEDVREFLDSSTNGVVFFSLGSNLKSSDFPPETLQAIINTFAKSKYNLLWKFEKELPNLPKNIKISTWLPQRAILAHPNVKAFISHGGAGSTVEAIYMGVPMIAIPFVADQRNNAAESVRNGHAIILERDQISLETLTRIVTEIIDNKSYSQNVKKRSDLYRNQEMNPMEKAIFWVEHVIRHKGTAHMKSISTKIPLYQYLLLDVIAFYCVLLIIILSVMYFSTKFVLRKICRFISLKSCKKEKIKKN